MRLLLSFLTLTGIANGIAAAAEPVADPRWKSELLQHPIKAFCVDFNWQVAGNIARFADPGHWADASPEQHIAWYADLGANVVQTFVLSCNGYAWYKGGPIPEQPGLKHDFLTEMVQLGHRRRMLVLGYYCIGANTLWGQRHPEQSYGTPNNNSHVPLTKAYVDYLCESVAHAMKKTQMDGFMLDWPGNTSGRWLECEKTMYRELMGRPFPGADKITAEERADFDRRAVLRCWTRVRDTARKVKPDCILWLNGLELHTLEGVDWLLNENGDTGRIEQLNAAVAGTNLRLIQNHVWGRNLSRSILADAKYHTWDFYGFAAPRDNSLPLPVRDYLGKPAEQFNVADRMGRADRSIAALARFYLGKPMEFVRP